MALKSRTSFPPMGFLFYQAETGWSSPPHIGFGPTVDEIIKHRKANPRFSLATDRATVEMELEGYTEARLRSQYGDGANEWVIGNSPPTYVSPISPRLRPQAVGAAGAAARNKVVAGIGLLVDWMGEGIKPAEQGVANQRAQVCLLCPHNKSPTIVQAAYGVVANGLHLLMEARNDMKLSTPFDDRLQTCAVCDCDLKLKIFAQKNHVQKHTSPSVRDALWEKCWIRSEA